MAELTAKATGALGRTSRRRAPAAGQLNLFERLDSLARRAESADPSRPALAVLASVLALMGLGLLVQASHASTTLDSEAFQRELVEELLFRAAGLVLLLGAAHLGPQKIRRFVPALLATAFCMLILVFLPPLGAEVNGSNRWLRLGSLSFQPSELARVVLVLWIADRCVRLGPMVRVMRRGVLPMLLVSLAFFALILVETDLGAAMLLLLCALCTMWVGGARPMHVAGSMMTFGGGALLLAISMNPYVRERMEIWFGHTSNEQVANALRALAGGGWFGAGVGRGISRNLGVPYLQSDFALAQVGEELGLFGILLVIGLLVSFAWSGLRVVVSIRDRYGALCAFGLVVSTCLGAMLHVQVVAGLAPPKGMNLPFISDGGSSLLMSSLAVGLALGACRGNRDHRGDRDQAVLASGGSH